MARSSHGWVGILPSADVLAAAITAALDVRGWRCAPLSEPPAPEPPAPEQPGPPLAVLLFAEEAGAGPPVTVRPAPPDGNSRYPPVIAVATARAMPWLAPPAQRGLIDAVVDADLPLTGVIDALDGVLSGRRELPPPGRLAAALHHRAEEARRCDRLSRRESAVLAGILDGRPAADLAAAEHVSLPTVRTQIRGVLTKLEVSSQLAAAATARRSWTSRPLEVFVS